MKRLKEIFNWLGSLVIAFLIVVLIGVFVFQPTKVIGHSMDPTLRDTQRVYISKLLHTFSSTPNYDNIVIIDRRVDRKRTFLDDLLDTPILNLFNGGSKDREIWIKRVIGKPGDVLEFKDNKVFRNGTALNEPYIKETMNYKSDEKFIVPADHIFVMGDNRNYSSDSRMIGFIPIDHVLGKKI